MRQAREVRGFAACVALVAAPILPATANAQILRGTVTDHATGRPMEGVLVELSDPRGQEPVVTSTNATGDFSLRIPRDGSFVIRATHLGYQTFQSETIELGTRDIVDIALQLSVEPIDLQPILVRVDRDSHLAEFERRRLRYGQGHFITRQEIERRPISRPSELLIGAPGLSLSPQRDEQGIPQDRYIVTLPGTLEPCNAHIFIDGIEVTQTARSTVDDLLNADWLGGVEVYRTVLATPSEYQRAGCGSVLFWTQARESGRGWGWLKGAAVAGFVVLALILTR
jgi:hypothetical protein